MLKSFWLWLIFERSLTSTIRYTAWQRSRCMVITGHCVCIQGGNYTYILLAEQCFSTQLCFLKTSWFVGSISCALNRNLNLQSSLIALTVLIGKKTPLSAFLILLLNYVPLKERVQYLFKENNEIYRFHYGFLKVKGRESSNIDISA